MGTSYWDGRHHTAPEQALHEAEHEPTPLGPKRHLHYIVGRNPGHWVVREKRGPLCGTPRCRLVAITEAVSTEAKVKAILGMEP